MQGEGYNCITNKTAGDGEWSNVAAQRRWIERRLVAGGGRGDYFINTISPKYQNSISGEISLRPAATNLLGGELVKGNVYFDDQPICDDGFGREEAIVACRCVLF